LRGKALRGRDLLSIADLSPQELRRVIEVALRMKREGWRPSLGGKLLALLFEKPSLRTRVSFEVAMRQLGGQALYLSPAEVGMGVREPVADVARVLDRYVDIIAARTFAHATVEELARFARVPVINALSDYEHPCQALGDLLTIYERKGGFEGIRLAFIGDGNNVARSLALACAMVGMEFVIASPPGYSLEGEVRERAQALGGRIRQVEEPREAALGAHILYTDVWTSMGQEGEREERQRAFAGYQVNRQLLSLASPEVLVMHPLPAHRGEEIEAEVIEGPRSVVFDQAENRLHAQRALLALLLAGEG